MTQYYIRPDGHDFNNGLSDAQAFQTFEHAFGIIPGPDDFLNMSGDMPEDIIGCPNGTSGHPFTIQRDANYINGRIVNAGLILNGNSYINILNFGVYNIGYPTQSSIITNSHDITIQGCVLNGGGAGSGIIGIWNVNGANSNIYILENIIENANFELTDVPLAAGVFLEVPNIITDGIFVQGNTFMNCNPNTYNYTDFPVVTPSAKVFMVLK